MSHSFPTVAFALLLACAPVCAAEQEAPAPTAPPDTDVTVADLGDPAAQERNSAERGTPHSLSTVISRGEDKSGLSMEQKWSHDVVVCKRQQVSGSRITRKVCHTRGEWQAMRNNARESVDAAIREALIYGVDGG
ncbi:MAG: hypothetical protein KDI71_07110 [Xanthomonadales bacterium]|nr:hypothetical protein [Xanthomonadales bacterium]